MHIKTLGPNDDPTTTHGEFLRGASGKDGDFVKKLLSDPDSVPLDPADRAILKFVEKMTLMPSQMTAADVQSLRDVGFSDENVLEICGVAAFFNYVARIADALGIELEEHYSDWSRFLGFEPGPTVRVDTVRMGDAFVKAAS